MTVGSSLGNDDAVFVKTVHYLIKSRNLLCRGWEKETDDPPLTHQVFRVLLDRHVAVVEALCRYCEEIPGGGRWLDQAIRQVVPLRKWLDSGRDAPNGHLMRKIRTLAHAEDTVLLPTATLLMGPDDWHNLNTVVEQLEQALPDLPARMTRVLGRHV